jgi:hypothetical protein
MRSMLTALLFVTLTACGGGGESGTQSQPDAPSATLPTSSSSETQPPTDSSDVSTDEPSVGKFGETLSFNDGLDVTVSQPVRFRPSSSADMDGYPLPKRGVPIRFAITLTNSGSSAMGGELPLITVTSAGESIQEVGLDDPAFGIDALAEDSRILPGKKAVSQMGYFVVDPKDISIDVAVSGYDTVTFSSEGG